MPAPHWNRHGRRSGGNRPVKIVVGDKVPERLLSIQCFERRHSDCCGAMTFLPGRCECPCHQPKESR